MAIETDIEEWANQNYSRYIRQVEELERDFPKVWGINNAEEINSYGIRLMHIQVLISSFSQMAYFGDISGCFCEPLSELIDRTDRLMKDFIKYEFNIK